MTDTTALDTALAPLALHGGEPVRRDPIPKGQRFGDDELQELKAALEQNTLFYYYGSQVRAFAQTFADMHGRPAAIATSSGTAALHVAIGCLQLPPGREVITSPVTDYGTIIGLLYQGLIPVFADLDPRNGLMTPETVEAVITPNTGAVLAVHLAGNPCDLTGLQKVCARHNIPLIEDCAQAYLAEHQGQLVGTVGRFGCYSTNDYKHISTGDGGLLLINRAPDAPVAQAFADKNYRRDLVGGMRCVAQLAPNYRMSELAGAVGLAQLRKLPWIIQRRQAFGDALRAGLQGIPGLTPMYVREGDRCAYWFFTIHLDLPRLSADRNTIAAALRAEGIPARPGAYIDMPLYRTPLFERHSAFPGSEYPFNLLPEKQPHCPGAEEYLDSTIILEVNEHYDDELLEQMLQGVRKVCFTYLKQ